MARTDILPGNTTLSEAEPMIKRILFHIGVPKTATTSLQLFLWQNRNRLKAAGALYPSTCLWHDKSHHKLFFSLRGKIIDGQSNNEWKKEKERLRDEIREAQCRDLIISSELLANLRDEEAYHQLLDGIAGSSDKEIFVLLGLRNICKLYLSNYFQRVRDPRIALSMSLAEWVRQGLTIKEIDNALDWQHKLTLAGARNTLTRIEVQSKKNPVPFLHILSRLYGLKQETGSIANASPTQEEILVLRRLNEITGHDESLRLRLRSAATRKALIEILRQSNLTRRLKDVEAGLTEEDVNTALSQQQHSQSRVRALIGTSKRQYNTIYRPTRWTIGIDSVYALNLPEISAIADKLIERLEKESSPVATQNR